MNKEIEQGILEIVTPWSGCTPKLCEQYRIKFNEDCCIHCKADRILALIEQEQKPLVEALKDAQYVISHNITLPAKVRLQIEEQIDTALKGEGK